MVASLNLMLSIWRNGDCRGYSLLIPIFPFSFKEKKYRGWSSKEDLSADYFDGTDFTLPLLSVHTSIFEVVASVPRKRLCGDLVSSAFFFFVFSFSFLSRADTPSSLATKLLPFSICRCFLIPYFILVDFVDELKSLFVGRHFILLLFLFYWVGSP